MTEFIMHPRRCGKTQNIDAENAIKIKEYKKPFNRNTVSAVNIEKMNIVFNIFMTMDLSFGNTQGLLNNPFITEKDITNVTI